jgi:acyl carrier protein
MREDIRDTVIRMIADHLGLPPSSLDLNALIMDDLGGDKLDHIELIITIEERFGINIPESERATLLRISDVVDYSENHEPAALKQ